MTERPVRSKAPDALNPAFLPRPTFQPFSMSKKMLKLAKELAVDKIDGYAAQLWRHIKHEIESRYPGQPLELAKRHTVLHKINNTRSITGCREIYKAIETKR